jgi:hypothetical protein
MAFLVMALLYAGLGRPLYFGLIRAWGVIPFRFPFLDTDMVLSALRCRRLGFDVFASNPCDALGRVYDYSPLWLVAASLPVTTAWIKPVGLGFDLGFLLSLLLLPPGRCWRETGLTVLATVSTATVFALERGNNDLVIFVLVASAAALASRSTGFRLLGYCLALLAGLLKYYPLAAMGLATRERPKAFLAVTFAGAGTLAAFAVLEGRELARALALIPTGPWFGDMFGAPMLPGGLAAVLHLSHGTATAFELVLVISALTLGARIGAGAAVRTDLAALTQAECTFLMAGSLLVLGCFLAVQNIGYRAIHLLLLMPGMTALWRVGRRPGLYAASTVVVILLVWDGGWRGWLDATAGQVWPSGANTVRLATWLLREAFWWWIVTVLAALLTGLLLRSEMGQAVAARLAPHQTNATVASDQPRRPRAPPRPDPGSG